MKMLLKPKLYLIFAFAVALPIISSIGIYADGSRIPDWVKNNAKWWADGQIGESEYMSSLQFLINQGIIQIPIKEVIATKTTLTDSERAQSFVVTFSNGDFFATPKSFYTFNRFEHISSATSDDTLDVSKGFETTPAFLLSSLPSKDKLPVYKLVNSFITPGHTESFDVKVDVLSGSGDNLLSYSFEKCVVVDFSVFLEQDKEIYSFSKNDGSEIRDVILFKCQGFKLLV